GLTASSLALWLIPKAANVPHVWRAAFGFTALSVCLTAVHESAKEQEMEGFTRAEKMAIKERHATELAYSQMAFENELQQRLGMAQPQQQQQQQQTQLPAAQNVYVTVDANGQVTLPTEDLAQTIADAGSDEQNFLFVGKSQSGKTSMLVNTIHRKNQRHDGLVDWFIFNGKPEKTHDWGGLAHSLTDYWEVNSEEKAAEMFGQFQACVGALQDWQSKGTDHYPMFLVMDEVNNQRILMTDNDRKKFDKKMSLYATQCMSEQSGLWISTHSHLVTDIGLNRQLQSNFQVIALGRNGKYESIASAIDDEYLIRDKDLRIALKSQLQAYKATGEKGAIAFTNVGGDSRLVKLPQYSKDVRISASPLNTSAKSQPPPQTNQPVMGLREQLETMWSLPPAQSPPEASRSALSSEMVEFLRYCANKSLIRQWVKVREIRKNWAGDHGIKGDALIEFLETLTMSGWGQWQDSTRRCWMPSFDPSDLL
ncbi:MAG: hypothetical protein WBA57_11955, partial [Elainellaceae cyanobacterium]